jgi:hypothetical protein
VTSESKRNHSGAKVKVLALPLTEGIPTKTFVSSAPLRLLPRACCAGDRSHTSSRIHEMMMAHDSSPPPSPGLAAETTDRARMALAKYLEDADAGGPELRDALDQMANEARARQMLPEQLLVVLKDIWYALPAVRSLEDSGAQIRLLQRVVTMCIKEYYR